MTQSEFKLGAAQAEPTAMRGETQAIELDLEAPGNLMRLAWRTGRDHFPCTTSRDRALRGGTTVHPESFTAMVVADLVLGHKGTLAVLVRDVLAMLADEYASDEDVFYFFKEHERLPADADCTALGLSVMLLGGLRVHEQAHRALDKILGNVDQDGVVETYFDPTGERDGIVDHVVCANVLFLAYQLGRGDEVQATLEYVHRVLIEESYLDGSRYYHSPDTFLYFLGRVVHHFPQTHGLLLEPLRDAVRKRQRLSTDTLDVAQRVLLSVWLEIDDEGELDLLAGMREGDGNWPNDALFRYGRKKVYFGSRVMATAFALKAVTLGKERRDELAATEERVDGEFVYGGDNVRYVSFGG